MRRGVAQSGRAPAWGVGGRRFESDHPDQKNKAVNEPTGASVNSFLDSVAPTRLRDTLSSFIYSSAHKSPKTIKTLHKTLSPFIDYLHRSGVEHHLDITRQHVEGFIRDASRVPVEDQRQLFLSHQWAPTRELFYILVRRPGFTVIKSRHPAKRRKTDVFRYGISPGKSGRPCNQGF